MFRINNPDKIGSSKPVIDINRYLGIRIGDLKYTTCASDINNWLVCDGRSLSRTSFPHLFDVLGTNFGSENVNTFKIPDFRGRVLGTIGSGTSLTTRALGASVGAETHTLSVDQIPAHSHTGITDSSGTHAHSITDPGHTHSYVNNTNDQSTDSAFATESAADNSDLGATTGSSTTGITINSAGAHTHTFTSNNTGGSQSHNNMQPTLFAGNVLILSKIGYYNDLPTLDFKLLFEY